jgi:hypothetical protein
MRTFVQIRWDWASTHQTPAGQLNGWIPPNLRFFAVGGLPGGIMSPVTTEHN